MRTLSVAHIGLSGERTDVTVADWVSALCIPCMVQACEMLKETDPAFRLPVCLFRLELVVVAYQCLSIK